MIDDIEQINSSASFAEALTYLLFERGRRRPGSKPPEGDIWTQEEFGYAVCASRQAVGTWLRGEKRPNARSFRRIEIALFGADTTSALYNALRKVWREKRGQRKVVRTTRHRLIDVGRLPDVRIVKLRGRREELAALDEAWTTRSTKIFTIVAWGGQGKTALVSNWVSGVAHASAKERQAILAWSFYDQGSKERDTSSAAFFAWISEKLQLAHPTAPSPGSIIAERLAKRRILLVLDGVETLQHGVGPQEGQIRDPDLKQMLLHFSNQPKAKGFVVVTSRLKITDSSISNLNIPPLILSPLQPADGAALLEDRGVRATKQQLESTSTAHGGHPLALSLLGSLVAKQYNGDLRARDRIAPLSVGDTRITEESIHGHALRVLNSIEKEWLDGMPLHTAVLRMVGLFDRPVEIDLIESLSQAPAIPGLQAWYGADPEDRTQAIEELRSSSLLLPRGSGPTNALDAHPIVREWFGSRYKERELDGWRLAHGRLFETFSRAAGDDNTSRPNLDLLFQAVRHGCRAGRKREALTEVHKPRICGFSKGKVPYAAIRKFGLIGENLTALLAFLDNDLGVSPSGLDESDGNWVVHEAANAFGTLGRIDEAREVLISVLKRYETVSDWSSASMCAFNIGHFEFTSGRIALALRTSQRAIDLADQIEVAQDGSNEWDAAFQRLSRRADRASYLAANGQADMARRLFQEAEAIHTAHSPVYSRLTNTAGAFYCQFLIDNGSFDEAADRAAEQVSRRGPTRNPLSLALDTLNLGRAKLGLALTAATDQASTHLAHTADLLDNAVSEIWQLNNPNFLSASFLARARYNRARGSWSEARSDLDQADDIAISHGMRLAMCDIALERARLDMSERERYAPLGSPLTAASRKRQRELAESAIRSLANANHQIEVCQYASRDAEYASLAKVARLDVSIGNIQARA